MSVCLSVCLSLSLTVFWSYKHTASTKFPYISSEVYVARARLAEGHWQQEGWLVDRPKAYRWSRTTYQVLLFQEMRHQEGYPEDMMSDLDHVGNSVFPSCFALPNWKRYPYLFRAGSQTSPQDSAYSACMCWVSTICVPRRLPNSDKISDWSLGSVPVYIRECVHCHFHYWI